MCPRVTLRGCSAGREHPAVPLKGRDTRPGGKLWVTRNQATLFVLGGDMKKILYGGATGLAALAALATAPAQATEGYFSHGFGAVNKSMAGAGVATGFDAMSQATNPAALTLVDPQFTVDLSIFSPRREYQYIPGPGQDSDRNYFFIPSMAGSYEIDAASDFGWAIYGNGGMNTTYAAPGPYGGGKTGVDLAQAFLQFTYAREVSSGVSVGVSPVLVAQRFKAFGLLPFGLGGFSSSPNNLTDNGYDWSYGYGGKIGVQAELAAGFRLGASYQTRMYMTEFDKYAGLFAEQGAFDIPPTLQAGLSWEPASGVTIALDYKRIWYGDIDSIANPILPNLFSAPGNLGTDNGAGFGWEDINAYKLGIEWEASPTLALRAGVGHNDNPIPSSEVSFNILAPGVQEWHYTAGLTWQVNPNHAVVLGAMYSPSNSVTGPFVFGGNAKIEMYQWEATAGWTWTF